mmetsp:Transcript_17123/g.25858  ORF Transcript_17123/g.25858 Transcript_17123/m.25858 type:complete len:90 (+) Transcript_17123:139-408(+)
MDLALVRKVSAIFQKKYSDQIHSIIVWPIGPIFQTLYAVAKPFLPKTVRQKLVLLRTRQPPELLEWIAPDQLLECWGGRDRWEFDPDKV